MVKAGEGWDDKNGRRGLGQRGVGAVWPNKNSPMEMGERKLWLNTVRENLIMINRAQ